MGPSSVMTIVLSSRRTSSSTLFANNIFALAVLGHRNCVPAQTCPQALIKQTVLGQSAPVLQGCKPRQLSGCLQKPLPFVSAKQYPPQDTSPQGLLVAAPVQLYREGRTHFDCPQTRPDAHYIDWSSESDGKGGWGNLRCCHGLRSCYCRM
jgi:hypothetical protein